MSTRSLMGRTLASTLIVLFPLTASPILASAGMSSLSGELVAASDRTPLAGARLHLEDPRTGNAFVSDPAGPDGRFDVTSVPAASYQAAVESNGSLYVVDTPLRLVSGESRTVRLAVRGTSSAGRARAGKAASGNVDSKPSFWSNPLTATLIVVGAAVVVGVVVDSATNGDETPASASAP